VVVVMVIMMMTYMSLISKYDEVIRNYMKFTFKRDKQTGEYAVVDPSARLKAYARVEFKLHILNFGRVVAYTLPSFYPREENIS
jgi:hypothetical protein